MGSFCGPVFGHCLDYLWNHFGDPFWDQISPRGAKISPKRPIKLCEIPKTRIYKNLKKTHGFSRFFGVQGRPRPRLQAQEVSKEAPEELQKLKNKGSENGPQFYNLLINFGTILGSILGKKLAQKGE